MTTVQEKGQKLADEGKVTEVPVVRAFYVPGESGLTYLVTLVIVPPLGYDRPELLMNCTCKHGKMNNDPAAFCAHIYSAVLQATRELKERT
jgi:hypothetical protein